MSQPFCGAALDIFGRREKMSAEFNSWVERARNVPIERVIEQRGIRLNGKTDRNGPCPVCGGTDRFSINTAKGVWNCRQCGVGGDVIALVEFLDGSTSSSPARR